jgi:hypothetical protein
LLSGSWKCAAAYQSPETTTFVRSAFVCFLLLPETWHNLTLCQVLSPLISAVCTCLRTFFMTFFLTCHICMSQACHEAAEGQSGQSFEDGSLRFSEAGGHRTKRELSDTKIYKHIYI